MKRKDSATRGNEAFHDHYCEIFGEEWPMIAMSLTNQQQPVLRFSPQNEVALKNIWANHKLPWKTLDWYPYALLWPETIPSGETIPGFEEKLFYPMNASSLLPALALAPQPKELILDACAAPGGKTLLMHDLSQGKAQIIANDLSPRRSTRMKEIFNDYRVENIETWHKKAEIIYKRHLEYFDKILIDAPCSSEKHVINSEKHLNQWSKGRVKQLQMRQIALICGLSLALKPGGTLVYSTCAVTPEENEIVVNKILQKKKNKLKLSAFNKPVSFGGGLQSYCNFPSELVARSPFQGTYNPIFVAKFEKTE